MNYVDPSSGTLHYSPHRAPSGLASHHQDILQSCAGENWIGGIETTVRSTIHWWARTFIRTNDGRLPYRTVLGNLDGAVRENGEERGKSGPVDYVVRYVRAFGIVGDRKAMALQGGV